jgi:hypothetical protein
MENNKNEKTSSHLLTRKGRRLIREKMFMQRLSNDERKAFEECMAILQQVTEDGNIEEACELLERHPFGKNKAE